MFMNWLNSKKGFLGPIGDDLPSLIPIVFSLLIFLGAFGFAFSIFVQRSVQLESAVEIVNISKSLRGTSYYTGYDDFMRRCNALGIKKVNYLAGLLPLSQNPLSPDNKDHFQGIDFENPKFFEIVQGGNTLEFKCTNVPDKLPDPKKGFIMRYYPVALEYSDKENGCTEIKSCFIVRPMLLVVITWS